MSKAIDVSTSVTINHFELGREFASMYSTEQAEFLQGMAVGFDELGWNSGLQIMSILESAEDAGIAYDVQRIIGILNEHFNLQKDKENDN